jgi:hypothetical protein
MKWKEENNMDIKYTTEINSSDLDFFAKEYLSRYIKERIIENKALMKRIQEESQEDYDENYSKTKTRLTVQDLVGLRLDEIADDAIEKISARVTFDLKVSL